MRYALRQSGAVVMVTACCICAASNGSTVTGMDGPKFESLYGKNMFVFSKRSRPALGPNHLPIKLVPDFFTGLKAAGT